MGEFPPGLSESLAHGLEQLGEEIIAAIAAEVPAYARPLEGSFGRGVRRGVEEALARFLALVEAGPGAAGDLATSRDVYVRLGRGEVRAGRSLDNLLSAYRVGARISWRRLGEAARHAGLDAGGLVALAEMMFAYIDGISAASADGYALAQFEIAGERERLWDRLGEMLLSGTDAATIEHAASTGAVRLPERMAAVLVPEGPDEQLPSRLPTGCPRTSHGSDFWLFLGDAQEPSRRLWLAERLAGAGAVVGPCVAWQQITTSVERASFARAALLAGRLPAAAGPEPLFTDDHLADLVLARDPGLLDDLARRRLGPLAALPERTRSRLAETLLCWLALHGQRRLVAERLHIHPQTVRYRVGQLRELFGAALDDPEARFELELLLRATIGLRPGSPAEPPGPENAPGAGPGPGISPGP
ncbi:PucR family transcriptional regulator [Parafrankia sp. EUN1f]|uniref:PucR family transcriptional regulator n=1 Tax=Parafrankia sp. EUN1f TaxID=102897 RepID=UPI0001C4529A|nr:PucR family transcriptional regulator [Parafrankia sp. EUN1f]EFC79096.1 putative transcriptional regulator, PucR family [Parafrankia sp. EUN1f]